VTGHRTFDELVAEADAQPVAGWDFSWLAGRATEERPAWGYSGLLRQRLAGARAVLDIQTGGGEVLAGALRGSVRRPAAVAATESWPPNAVLAQRAVAPWHGAVVRAADAGGLPFRSGSFDLVISRHPAVVVWPEIARVLARGGTYLSQQVGPGTNRELTDFMMGPQPVNQARDPRQAEAAARAAGLVVTELREQSLRVEFFDVGAVVYFLRKVLWTVPGFTVAGYAGQLARMHKHIAETGSFVSHAQRFLITARAPGDPARSGCR
jgi:SAM-dependent methyltransferase